MIKAVSDDAAKAVARLFLEAEDKETLELAEIMLRNILIDRWKAFLNKQLDKVGAA